MSFKEKIENNAVLVIVVTAISAFLFGIGAYEGILRIANLETVSKGTYVSIRDVQMDYVAKTEINASNASLPLSGPPAIRAGRLGAW